MADKADLTFALITDIHLGWNSYTNAKAEAAIRDLLGLDFDLLVILGDVVDMREEYWPLYHSIIRKPMDRPTIFVRGNADYEAGGEAAWERNIGQPVRQSLTVGGVQLVTVGAMGTDHVLPVGDDVGEWLDGELARHPEKPTLALLHAPLKDTTFWSCSNTEDGCLARLLGPDISPFHLFSSHSEEISSSLERHPQVRLVLSGHCHSDNRMICDHGYGPLRMRDGIAYLASANLGGWEGIGRERREIRWIQVTDQEILVRTRDIILQRWVDALEFSLPVRPTRPV